MPELANVIIEEGKRGMYKKEADRVLSRDINKFDSHDNLLEVS